MSRRRVALILTALVLAISIAPSPVTAASRDVSTSRQGRLVPTPVEALDTRFSPTVPRVPRGGTVVFEFVGPVQHHAASDDLLGLYDTGNVAAGGPSVSYTFVAAGVYPFTCVLHIDQGMAGRIHVPMQATPTKGSLKRTYTLTWASAEAAYGFVYDVRVKRPDHAWSGWRSAVSERKDTYQPHAGKGVYRFEARMRRTDTGDASLWSDAVTITVG